MVLTTALNDRLNNLFKALWSCPEAISNCWSTSTYNNHDTYIHRDPFLLQGTGRFEQLYVLPEGCEVTATLGDSREYGDTMPKLSQSAIVIFAQDDGLWWERVAKVVDSLEFELHNYQENRKAELAIQKANHQSARQIELDMASEAIFKADQIYRQAA